MADEFLTVYEIAKILKLNQQTIRNWIDNGTLPALHVGRRVRIRREDFDSLIASSTPQAPKDAAINIWDGDIPSPIVPEATDG